MYLYFDYCYLVCHTKEEYKQIEDAYRTETKKELTKDIEKSFSGAIRKNLLNMLSIERRTNENPDKGQCEKLADLLINSGEKNWVEDENVFRDVFILCSPTTGVFFTCDNEKSVAAKGKYVKEKGLGGLIAWMASLDAENVITKAMYNSLYDKDYTFPVEEMIFTTPSVSAQIVATETGYDITIKNDEKSSHIYQLYPYRQYFALLIEKKFLASFLFLFLNNHQFHTSGAQHNVSITSSRTTKQSSRGTFHRSSPIFHFIFNYLFFIMYFYIIILYFLLIFN